MKTKLLLLLFLTLGLHIPLSGAYSDIKEKSDSKTAVDFVTEKGIMNGYADNRFKTDTLINRAEFITLLARYKAPDEVVTTAENACFKDIQKNAWYTKSICLSKQKGWLGGYANGKVKPAAAITLAESLKIMAVVFEMPVTPLTDGQAWYLPYLESMRTTNYIPASFTSIDQKVTRGQVAELLYRIIAQKHDLPSVNTDELLPASKACVKVANTLPANVDEKKIYDTWLSWYNQVRTKQGLGSLGYNSLLDQTAWKWSNEAKSKGSISHKRPGQKVYYDYKRMVQWFKDQGLTFSNVKGETFTENIGWGVYKCDQDDCTQELTDAIKTTFDFFMSEKGKKYAPHYDSIMNKQYKEIGLGIAVDEKAHKYYLTVHYATSIKSQDNVCN